MDGGEAALLSSGAVFNILLGPFQLPGDPEELLISFCLHFIYHGDQSDSCSLYVWLDDLCPLSVHCWQPCLLLLHPAAPDVLVCMQLPLIMQMIPGLVP